MNLFQDRAEAGCRLAARFATYKGNNDVRILALPRGGVPVAFEIAAAIGAPLDVLCVRKLGVPGQPELAMGAIASGGVRVMNDHVLHALDIDEKEIEAVAQRELLELGRRERAYRGDREPLEISGKIVILVDDGVATGASMKAAIAALRQRDPARLIVAVPHGAEDTCNELRHDADEVVCLASPWPYISVGNWYRNFTQVSDGQVADLLALAHDERTAQSG